MDLKNSGRIAFPLPKWPEDCPSSIMAVSLAYLSASEAKEICQHFQDTWRPNSQLLWSGMHRADAQLWADKHKLDTLTTAMGPLMNEQSKACLRTQKTDNGWSKYVHGASAIFAWFISTGEKVTVLSPPPPERFHPSGETYYQALEEPILKDAQSKVQIELVHPTLDEAAEFTYQFWPMDEMNSWIAKFGTLPVKEKCWRQVKKISDKLASLRLSKDTTQDGIQMKSSSFNGQVKQPKPGKTATKVEQKSINPNAKMNKKNGKTSSKGIALVAGKVKLTTTQTNSTGSTASAKTKASNKSKASDGQKKSIKEKPKTKAELKALTRAAESQKELKAHKAKADRNAQKQKAHMERQLLEHEAALKRKALKKQQNLEKERAKFLEKQKKAATKSA